MAARTLSTDFAPAFAPALLPSRGRLAERWKRIDRMMRRFGALPQLSLYKFAEDYFALDGNRPASVETLHQWSRRKI